MPDIFLILLTYYIIELGFSGVPMLKNFPANANDAGSLGWEDTLEKEMATYSSIFAWKISWTEEPGRLQPMG